MCQQESYIPQEGQLLSRHAKFLEEVKKNPGGEILVDIFHSNTTWASWNLVETEEELKLEGKARDGDFEIWLREVKESRTFFGKAYILSFPGAWIFCGPIFSKEGQTIGKGLTLHTSSSGFSLHSKKAETIINIISELSKRTPRGYWSCNS